MRSQADCAVSVEGVSKSFGAIRAVERVVLRVAFGQTFGLLGPSGCGKTTLIRLILGLLAPVAGSVTVLGERMPTRRVMHDVGYMPQSPALYDDLTVAENVGFFANLYGLRSREPVERVVSLMELGERLGSPIHTLSGGMKRRVSMACALVHQPRLLLLDEPTVGLDPRLRANFWGYFRQLNEQGVTIIASTHVMDEAEHCHRLGLMREGRVLVEGTPNDLRQNAGAATLEEAFLTYAEGRR
jgi:ABC-2 type transport system ATP-binding protein